MGYVPAMDTSITLSVAAVLVSVLALFASTFLTVGQLRLLRQTNHLPPIIELLSEFRSSKLHDNFAYVTTRLREEHDPELSIFELPEPARSTVIDTAYYYQTIASLVGFGVLDERIIVVIRTRIIRVWESIEPYLFGRTSTRNGRRKLCSLNS